MRLSPENKSDPNSDISFTKGDWEDVYKFLDESRVFWSAVGPLHGTESLTQKQIIELTKIKTYRGWEIDLRRSNEGMSSQQARKLIFLRLHPPKS